LRTELSELVALVQTLEGELPTFHRLKSQSAVLSAEVAQLRETNARLSAQTPPPESLALLAADLSAEREKNVRLTAEVERLQRQLDRALDHNRRLINAFADPCARIAIASLQNEIDASQ
jgi:cell division protein FtsB